MKDIDPVLMKQALQKLNKKELVTYSLYLLIYMSSVDVITETVVIKLGGLSTEESQTIASISSKLVGHLNKTQSERN